MPQSVVQTVPPVESARQQLPGQQSPSTVHERPSATQVVGLQTMAPDASIPHPPLQQSLSIVHVPPSSTHMDGLQTILPVPSSAQTPRQHSPVEVHGIPSSTHMDGGGGQQTRDPDSSGAQTPQQQIGRAHV